MTLENYYSNLIAQAVERQQRLAKLEETLRDEGLSEQQKQEKRAQHAVKETEFLRLKRSRLGVEDFEPLKVVWLLALPLQGSDRWCCGGSHLHNGRVSFAIPFFGGWEGASGSVAPWFHRNSTLFIAASHFATLPVTP